MSIPFALPIAALVVAVVFAQIAVRFAHRILPRGMRGGVQSSDQTAARQPMSRAGVAGVIAAWLLILGALIPLAAGPSGTASTTLTLRVHEDTYIKNTKPKANYGQRP